MRKDGMIEGYKTGGGGKQQPFGKNGRYGAKSEPGTTVEKDSFGSYRQNTDYQAILENDKRREAVKKYSDEPGRDAEEMGLNRSPVKAVGFARRDTWQHMRHAKEMGLNQREYEREAIKFFNSNKWELYYCEREKRYYRFDKKTLKVAMCDDDGIIRSYYLSKKGWFETKKGLKRV